MLAFIASFVFGALQVCLTSQLIYAFNKRITKAVWLFFTIKFLSYAVFIGVAVIKFMWSIGLFFCGFVAGAPIMAIALFVYKIIFKNKE